MITNLKAAFIIDSNHYLDIY